MVRHEPEVWHFWQVGDLGFANELGNYAEYSGAPNEEETLQFARALIDVSLSKLFENDDLELNGQVVNKPCLGFTVSAPYHNIYIFTMCSYCPPLISVFSLNKSLHRTVCLC